jgi:hypothetical protein
MILDVDVYMYGLIFAKKMMKKKKKKKKKKNMSHPFSFSPVFAAKKSVKNSILIFKHP